MKKYMKIFQFDISEKTSMGQKTLHIKINKMDGFAKINGEEFRHLVLFYNGLFDKICDKIKYLLSKKSGITDSINHNFGEIRINSYSFLPIEKVLTFHNVIILIKSVVNKNKNEYYYNIFFEKGYYKGKSDTGYFLMNFCTL